MTHMDNAVPTLQRFRTLLSGPLAPAGRTQELGQVSQNGIQSPRRSVQDGVKARMDAALFTAGVAFSFLVEYVVLSRPEWFASLFYFTMAALLIHRFFSYRATREHFYMLDFCYALQLSTWLQTLTCTPDSLSQGNTCSVWFQTNFALSNGPIAIAIIFWKNSLVFHSADKMTSFALHLLPCVFHYLIRWSHADPPHPMSNLTGFVIPLLYYLSWQALYLTVQFTFLDKDPSLVTSLRYLVSSSSDKPATRFGYYVLRRVGALGPQERLDPLTVKTTLIYVFFQLGYVVLCLLPMPVLYNCQICHQVFIVCITLVGIWNGGSYYIDIFSTRYKEKFEATPQGTPNRAAS